MVLSEFNTENKYFGQGLAWLQQYSMSSILQKAGILPDENCTVGNVNQAIVNQLQKNPSIRCLYDPVTQESYLNEIRICFDKSLQLTDCNGIAEEIQVSLNDPEQKILTNCDLNRLVSYPSKLPPAHIKNTKSKWEFPFVNVYKLLKLINWMTL